MPQTIEIASLGMSDSIFLMLLALVVFGPRRLPQIGRQIGKLMYEFRKASNDFKFQMEEELRNAEEADRRKKEEADRQKALASGAAAQPFVGGYMNAPAEESPKTPGESEGLRIQPPSTGEQIPAAHPARTATEPEPAIAPEPPAEAAVGAEAAGTGSVAEIGAMNAAEVNPAVEHAPEQTAPAIQQESHHG